MNDYKIVYRGLSFKPSVNGVIVNWIDLNKYIEANKRGYFMFDGWAFSFQYGVLYLFENKYWSYYIPPSGLKHKRVLDVGGGCGETAKYFLDRGADHVHIIESNKECERYLKYNKITSNNKMTYEICRFKMDSRMINDINNYYDLLKLDIEGYEMELLPYLDRLNIDIISESHCNYITDKLLENGFKILKGYTRNKEIYGGVVQLCRWKK